MSVESQLEPEQIPLDQTTKENDNQELQTIEKDDQELQPLKKQKLDSEWHQLKLDNLNKFMTQKDLKKFIDQHQIKANKAKRIPKSTMAYLTFDV